MVKSSGSCYHKSGSCVDAEINNWGAIEMYLQINISDCKLYSVSQELVLYFFKITMSEEKQLLR